MAFANIRHLSTALSALQQSFLFFFGFAVSKLRCLPTQHDTKTCTHVQPVQVCVCVCVCACVGGWVCTPSTMHSVHNHTSCMLCTAQHVSRALHMVHFQGMQAFWNPRGKKRVSSRFSWPKFTFLGVLDGPCAVAKCQPPAAIDYPSPKTNQNPAPKETNAYRSTSLACWDRSWSLAGSLVGWNNSDPHSQSLKYNTGT